MRSCDNLYVHESRLTISEIVDLNFVFVDRKNRSCLTFSFGIPFDFLIVKYIEMIVCLTLPFCSNLIESALI